METQNKQPEALRLADASDNSGFYRAPQEVERRMAAELRRQNALIAELVEALSTLVVFLPSDHPEMPDTQRIGPGFVSIRWGDLRQAHDALSKAKNY